MTAQFVITRRIQFSETDLAGIVHFSNFYIYMEQAEHEFFRSHGLSIMQQQPDGSYIGWPRVSATCSFTAPIYFEDLLEVRMNVSRIGVKSLTMEFEFWRDETKIAHGRLKTACCHFVHGEQMKSIAIPAEYLEKIVEADSAPAESS